MLHIQLWVITPNLVSNKCANPKILVIWSNGVYRLIQRQHCNFNSIIWNQSTNTWGKRYFGKTTTKKKNIFKIFHCISKKFLSAFLAKETRSARFARFARNKLEIGYFGTQFKGNLAQVWKSLIPQKYGTGPNFKL